MTAEPADRRPVDIVILGGGYTAVWGYRSLVRRLRRRVDRGEVRITVVSASRNHAFHGWTGEVLNGLVRYDRTRTPLGDLMPRARIVHGRVDAVDLDTRTVTYRGDGGEGGVRYDHLLVGVGTFDATDRIPGLGEHGWSVKTDGGLIATRDHLASVLERAASCDDDDERSRLLTFVVAGGGFAGVEMAAAIAELIARRTAGHPMPAAHPPRITLVHSGGELLSEVRPRFDRIADYATAQLADLGVEVRFGARVVEVTAEGAVLQAAGFEGGRPEGGELLPAATAVSTVGQAQVPLAGTDRVVRDSAGRMVTDPYLRTSVPGVWAGGDAAAVPHVVSGDPCPPNALWAIKHGVRVGDNIARAVGGRRLRRFRFLGLGQAASLGVGRGAAELFGIQLTGWVAWAARWGFFHFFMPSRRRTAATIGEWLAIPFRGRYFADVPSSPGPAELETTVADTEVAGDRTATVAA